MTQKDYSLAALNRFLDYTVRTGLLKGNTAQSRKIAANKIFSILSEADQKDLKKVDLDDAFDRFSNLQGTDYKPESLRVYFSRARSGLIDFFAYTENPAGFKPAGAQRSVNKKSATKNLNTKNDASFHQPAVKGVIMEREGGSNQDGLEIPIPLRDGVMVRIANIPHDLTSLEADRLAVIIRAYAIDSGV